MPISLPGVGLLPGITAPVWWGSGSYNGLSWGLDQPAKLARAEGLDDLPAMRTNDTPRGGDDGVWGGNDRMGERVIIVTIRLLASDPVAYATLLRQALAAFTPLVNSDLPMYVNDSNRVVFARCRRRAVKQQQGGRSITAEVIAEMHMRDPLIYDATPQLLTTGLPSATGGVHWPIHWPAKWGSPTQSGVVQFVNLGDRPTRPVLTITGPIDTSFTVANLTVDKRLTFAAQLLAGDTMVLDLAQYSAMVNGSVSRKGTITTDSRWWACPPGTSTITFNANTAQPGATMTLQGRSAWA